MKTIVHRASIRWGPGNRPQCRVGISRPTSAEAPALFAAMHAVGFCLTLSEALRLGSVAGGDIAVTSSATLTRVAGGWANTDIHLTVLTRLPGLSQARFIDAAIAAKAKCLILRPPRTTVSMKARLQP